MGNPNVEDDYYSSISSSSSNQWSSSQKSVKLKPKKIVKKKVVKKTAEPKVEKITENVEKKDESQILNKTQKIQPKMRVVSRTEKKEVKKPIFKKRVRPTSSGGFHNKPSAWSEWKKLWAVQKGGFKKPLPSSTQWSSWSQWGAPKKKVYSGSDKQKDSNKKYDNSRNTGLKPYNKSRKTFRGHNRRFFDEIEDTGFSRSKKAHAKKEEKKVEDIKQNLVSREWETVVLWEICTLKELSEKIWVNLVKLIAEFMKNGMMVNINSKIDFDSASIIAEAFDINLKKDDSGGMRVEDLLSGNIIELLKEDDDAKLIERPPVISIMGHVDHWKTSLLDHIRESTTADGEAGWITQSIGAYQIEKDGKKITFLDTPGHEAFTVMRSRWAKSTDIAILVVAADEWVKPQTVESISHAKEAGIPVIVAINKMDKEWANPDHVKGQLSENWLTPEDWGGDTPMVPVSAKTGFGIDDLLEIVILMAEMKELKANPDRRAVATIIESHLDLKLWPVSTVLINTWSIKKWDDIVCNGSYWKVKILKNYENKSIKFGQPGDPVLIVWLDAVANWGDILQVMRDAQSAKQKSSEYRDIILAKKRNEVSGLEILMSRIKAWNLKQLKVVVKADTNWSLEALKAALEKLSTPETNVSIIHSWVWNITEGDVIMCSSSKAVLIGFWVAVVPTAKKVLEESKIEFLDSKIIYHITERIEKIVTWMLDPKEVTTEFGIPKVWGIFYTSKEFMVAGLILQPEMRVEKWAKARVIRNKSKVWEGVIESVKSWIEEIKEFDGPGECGIKFVWSVELEMWDYLELYKTEIQK